MVPVAIYLPERSEIKIYENILDESFSLETSIHNNDRDRLRRENTSSLSQEPLLLRHQYKLQYAFTFFYSFVEMRNIAFTFKRHKANS
jgi:hypothetical protein